MSMLMHLLRADFRRLRLMIAAWILLMASVTAVYGLHPVFNANLRFAYTGWLVLTLLWWAMQLFKFVIVPIVVHTDPAVGSEAFWMTRPMRPAVLVASKLLLLVTLIVLVPTATEIAMMALYDVPVGELIRVALQTAVLEALWLALLTVPAALTTNTARYAVCCGAGLVLLAVSLGISEAISAARPATGEATAHLSTADWVPSSLFTGTALDHTPELVAVVLTIASGVVLILIQYGTRLRRRSIPGGVAGLVVALSASMLWRWPLLQPGPAPPAWATVDGALTLSADPGTIRTGALMKRIAADRPQRVSTSFSARLNGLPPGWIPTTTLIGASLDLGGHRLESGPWGYPAEASIDSSDESAQQIVLRQVLGARELLEPARSGGEQLLALSLGDDEIARYAPAVGRYSGRFRVALTRPEVIATIPLRAGATGQAGAFRVVIDRVSARTGGGVRMMPPSGQVWQGAIWARESNARSLFDGMPASSLWYCLRNKRAGEAIRGAAPYDSAGTFAMNGVIHPTSLPPRLFMTLQDVSSSGFRARAVLINFVALTTRPSDDEAALGAWLADAELVVVRMSDAGWVERTLEISEFPLVPAAPAPASPLPVVIGSQR